MNEGKGKFFSKTNIGGIFKRSFAISKDTFIFSYLSKIISIVLSIFIAIGTQKLIDFILREIELPPTILTFILISIVLAYLFITLLTFYLTESILIHLSTSVIVGEKPSFNSFNYTFKRAKTWVSLALLTLFAEVLLLVLLTLISNIGNEILIQIFMWVYRIASFMLAPFIITLVPIIIFNKSGLFKGIKQTINVVSKNYIKFFVISSIIILVFFGIEQLYSIINSNLYYGRCFSGSDYHNLMNIGFENLFNTKILGELFSLNINRIVLLFVYYSVVSSVYVVAVGLRTSLLASLSGNNENFEKTVEKVKNNIELN